MKRLLALILALGLLATVVPTVAARFQEEPKKKDDKKDGGKKEEPKKEAPKKEEPKKEEPKKEEPKLTDAQKADLKALTGSFTIVSYERDGKKETSEAIKKMKVVQEGAEWKFFVGEDITLGKDTLNPEKSPKEVDSYYLNGPAREKTVKGLYKIDGDTVTYIHADPGKDRPKDFTTKADSGLTLIVLKKSTEEKKEEKKDKKEEKKEDKKEEKKDK